jgi:hypothetical protein
VAGAGDRMYRRGTALAVQDAGMAAGVVLSRIASTVPVRIQTCRLAQANRSSLFPTALSTFYAAGLAHRLAANCNVIPRLNLTEDNQRC